MEKNFKKVVRVSFAITLLLSATTLFAQNPSMVADINPGSTSSAASHLAVFNSKLYFQANDGTNGAELWMYDGTNPPSLVADIRAGSSSSSPSNPIVFNSKLYFQANDGTNGAELYVYDGVNPPSLVSNISSGAGSSFPAYLTVFNSKLYFQADDGINGMELWQYDGTNPPAMVTNISAGAGSSFPSYLTVFNSKLHFQANDGTNGTELWMYDGTNPPSMIANISAGAGSSNPSYLILFGSKLYFQANDGTTGAELWQYDGINPPSIVADISSGATSSTPSYPVVFNSKLYFQANNGTTGAELWQYDGINPPSIVYDIYTGASSSSSSYHTVFNSKIYFRANEGTNGPELWEYDGVTTPVMTADIRPGALGSSPSYFTLFNSKLYFQAQNGTNGYELWVLTGSCSASSSSISPVSCNTYTVPSGDETYTVSGTYSDTIPNAGGCDSIISINLTINSSNTGSQTASACNSYTWAANGNTYTTSGVYSATLTNVSGCDSVVTLNLTINSGNTGSQTASACNSYTWAANGNTYTTSGVYSATLTNVSGCDSVVTLNLTINSGNTGSQTASACNSYTWTANGNTYTTSGTYSATLTNVSGCDSVLTLNLTINSVDTAVVQNNNILTANASGATYQWVDCNNGNAALSGETNQSFTATTNGNFAVAITQGSCTDTSSCYQVTGLTIMENGFGASLLIYPNPTNGQLSVVLGQNYESIDVVVKNITGQIVSVRNFKTSQKLDFTIEGSKGVYFVEINAGDTETVTLKVVKE